MPRRAAAQKRETTPDPIYNSKLVAQFVNKVMLGGKKSTAEKITYRALEIMGEKKGDDPVAVLKQAVDAVTPSLEVRSRRVGGATYQVPVEVPTPPRAHAGDPLDRRLMLATAARRRWRSAWPTSASTLSPTRGRLEEERRYLPDGSGQQGLRPLPLVSGEPGAGGSSILNVSENIR